MAETLNKELGLYVAKEARLMASSPAGNIEIEGEQPMTAIDQVQSNRTITAFFDKQDMASAAVEKLAEAGFPRTSIRVVSGTSASHTAKMPEENSFWAGLKGFFLSEEDRCTYAEGLRRGGYLVMVSTSEPNYGRALDILDREGAIDIDQRAQSWRQEGWTANAGTTRAPGSAAVAGPQAGEEVIPVIEEELQVGKRETGHGRVRVRSYVVDTPVSEQVTLKQEHVSVERRPVDRPLSQSDFQQRTIEAQETREEPVVKKQARVKEEVGIKKDVDHRTETVTDKVRHTEVKVEDDRSQRGAPTGKPR